MNKAINEDFDYRKELKSLFDVPVGAIWDCIDKQDNNQHFWGIYHKDTILDPDYEFSDEIKEQVNNPIDQNSIWFSVESKHVIEIGTDYDLACFYDNYRESHCKSVDDIKDNILDNYIYFCQKHQHDNSLECEITDLFNDDVTNYLKHRNLNIDDCTVIGDISEFNAICEISDSRAGYNPELSYGSHIFQDLVEAQILYMAVFPGNRTLHFHPELLNQLPDMIAEIPGGKDYQGVISLRDVSVRMCELYHDLADEHILLRIRSSTT